MAVTRTRIQVVALCLIIAGVLLILDPATEPGVEHGGAHEDSSGVPAGQTGPVLMGGGQRTERHPQEGVIDPEDATEAAGQPCIVVRVVEDVRGEPVHGALVELVEADWRMGSSWRTSPSTSTGTSTDKEGRASLCGRGVSSMLRVRAQGFVPLETHAGSLAGDLEVRLRRGNEVAVRILSSAGLTIERAHVVVYSRGPSPAGAQNLSWRFDLPNGVGSIALPSWDDLSRGGAWMMAYAPGHVASAASLSDGSSRGNMLFELSAAPELRVAVRSAATGEPVAGALVEGPFQVQRSTDGTGHATLNAEGWRSGTSLRLAITHAEYQWARKVLDPADVVKGDVVFVELEPGVAYPIVVLDAKTKQPVSDFALELHDTVDGFISRSWRAGSDGLVVLRLPARRLYVGSIRAPGYGEQYVAFAAEGQDAAAPLEPCNVELERERQWTGSFERQPEDERSPGWLEVNVASKVHALPERHEPNVVAASLKARELRGMGATALVAMRGDGSFSLVGIAPGTYKGKALERTGRPIPGEVVIVCSSASGRATAHFR